VNIISKSLLKMESQGSYIQFINDLVRKVDRLEQARGYSRVNRKKVNESSYAVATGDYLIAVTYSVRGACTIVIPDSQQDEDRVLVIKDEGRLSGTNNITVRSVGNNIDASTTATISTNGDSLTIYFDGTNWHSL